MGCIANQPIHTPLSLQRSSGQSSQKGQLISLIQGNKPKPLLMALYQQNLPLDITLTDQRTNWSIIHFCCRWNAAATLEHILKAYYVDNPRGYVDFVNRKTGEGYSGVHLCAIWGAQGSFRVLDWYGGIGIAARDRNGTTAQEHAAKCRSVGILGKLKRYRETNIDFTVVEGDRLTNLQFITQQDLTANTNTKQNPQKLDSINKKPQAQTKKISQQQKNLLQAKITLQTQKQKLLDQKIEKLFDHQQQKVQMSKSINNKNKGQLNSNVNENQKRVKTVNKKKDQENLKNQKQGYEKEIKKKDQQLQRLDKRLRQIEQNRFQQQKQKIQALNVQYAQQNHQTISQLSRSKHQNLQTLPSPQPLPRASQSPATNSTSSMASLEQAFKYLGQEVPAQIRQLYQGAIKAGQFVDREFPAGITAIGNQKNQNFQYFKECICWLRPRDIFQGQDYQLYEKGIDPNDIQQGQLGVCYMLATISSLATIPEYIQKLFVFSDLSLGFHVLKLYIHGVPKYIPIDDQIPCNKNTKYPIFTQPVGNEIWVMLIQKCWAKAIGSYLGAEGMVPDQMMEDVSGAPGFGGIFDDKDAEVKVPAAQHMKILEKHSNLGHTIVLTSGENKIEGIVDGHAYTLLKVFNIKGKYIFKIRNPWGNYQWQGEYSQKSRNLTPQLKKQLKYTSSDDGTFFISQKQLLKAFSYYSISIVIPTHKYNYKKFTSKANQDKYFIIKLSESSYTNFRLSQMFNRMLRDEAYEYSPVKFEIGRVLPNGSVQFLGEGDAESYYGAKSINFTENVCEELEAGQYFVRVNIQWKNPQKYNTAVLSVYSSCSTQITEIPTQKALPYLLSLYNSHAESTTDLQPTEDGLGYYRIDTMKGQFVLTAETELEGSYTAEFQMVKEEMKGVKVDLGRVTGEEGQGLKVRVQVSKGKPGVGTVNIVDLLQDQTTTGSVYITMWEN